MGFSNIIEREAWIEFASAFASRANFTIADICDYTDALLEELKKRNKNSKFIEYW